jgi:ribosomal protein S18 acetylase RimI-like enzyme
VPFADEHLPGAAVVLERAHLRHREAEPLLAGSDARTAVERAWGREGTSGVAAVEDGEVAGYLVGRELEDRHWARHVWVDRAGYAADDPELVRDLFAAAAEDWWHAGVRRYFANVPSLPERLDPWLRLGFAFMHQHAIRETGAEAALPDGLAIRRGGPDDLETAMSIDRQIAETQLRSPSFAAVAPGSNRDDWVETLEDPDVALFVAERNGRAVGHATLYAADPDLGTPRDAVYLASTATLAEARGTGAGLALTQHALAWAREAGYGSMWTNWRVTNLLASRFWPARGFRPTYVRLHRAPGIA